MRSISAAELMKQKDTGDVILLYGETKVGKSVTTLQTCNLPVLYIMTEPRDPKKFLLPAMRPELLEPGNCEFVYYDKFLDAIEYICTTDFSRYKTIVVDSFTHLMILLLQEITGDAYKARVDDPKKKADAIAKALTNQVKSSEEDYGALSGQMARFTDALNKLSQDLRTVVVLARVQSNPKYDRSLMAGPALEGKKFAKDMPGWFDFIGFVRDRIDANGKKLYPPRVSFSSDGSFLAGWTGVLPETIDIGNVVLNIDKILAVAHGEGGK